MSLIIPSHSTLGAWGVVDLKGSVRSCLCLQVTAYAPVSLSNSVTSYPPLICNIWSTRPLLHLKVADRFRETAKPERLRIKHAKQKQSKLNQSSWRGLEKIYGLSESEYLSLCRNQSNSPIVHSFTLHASRVCVCVWIGVSMCIVYYVMTSSLVWGITSPP